MKYCLIIGGGDCVWDDIRHAKMLLEPRPFDVIAINDMIELYSEPIHIACSLHLNKLETWLLRRKTAKFPGPVQVWAHRPGGIAQHHSADWGGSGGLFAVKIAMAQGYDKRILCGVPMNKTPHIVRQTTWTYAHTFRPAWIEHLKTIRDGTRSMSGWTAALLGYPSSDWLDK